MYSVLCTLYSMLCTPQSLVSVTCTSPLCCAGQLLLFYTMFTSENVEMIQ